MQNPVVKKETGSVLKLIKKISRYGLVYLAWILTGALGLLALLMTREAILSVYVALELDKWAYGAVDKLSFLFLGMAYLIAILYVERYYRSGVIQSLSLLLRRFLRVTLIEVGILVVVFGVQAL